jgi:hypothetical protein
MSVNATFSEWANNQPLNSGYRVINKPAPLKRQMEIAPTGALISKEDEKKREGAEKTDRVQQLPHPAREVKRY